MEHDRTTVRDMFRRVLASVPVVVLLLAGCGPSASAPTAVGSPAPTTAVPTSSPSPGTPAGTTAAAGSKVSTKGARPSVAPEVVVPSTTDAKVAEVLSGDWQTRVVAALRHVDARLVTDDAVAVKKVRATCRQMETGMFSAKVLPIIEARFSNPKVTVTSEMAQDIYSVLLQDACYNMNES